MCLITLPYHCLRSPINKTLSLTQHSHTHTHTLTLTHTHIATDIECRLHMCSMGCGTKQSSSTVPGTLDGSPRVRQLLCLVPSLSLNTSVAMGPRLLTLDANGALPRRENSAVDLICLFLLQPCHPPQGSLHLLCFWSKPLLCLTRSSS